jgi:hypothetical protein
MTDVMAVTMVRNVTAVIIDPVVVAEAFDPSVNM